MPQGWQAAGSDVASTRQALAALPRPTSLIYATIPRCVGNTTHAVHLVHMDKLEMQKSVALVAVALCTGTLIACLSIAFALI
jgi:hypothetical protein